MVRLTIAHRLFLVLGLVSFLLFLSSLVSIWQIRQLTLQSALVHDTDVKISTLVGVYRELFDMVSGDTIGSTAKEVVSELDRRIAGQQVQALQKMRRINNTVLVTVIIVNLLALSATVIFGYLLIKGITEPLKLLTKSTKAIADGDFDRSLPVKGRDEIAELSQAFNETTAKLKTLYDRLQESKRKYKLLANNVNDVIWVLDLQEERFTYVSPSIKNQRGFTSKEFLSLSPDKVFTPASLEKAQKALRQVRQDIAEEPPRPDEVLKINLESYCKDGPTIWCEDTCSWLFDENGQVAGIIGVSRDITQRREIEAALQQSQERYQLILNSGPDPVVLYDMQGNVLYCNPTFSRVFGWTMDELIDRTIEYVPEEARPETARMISRMKNGEDLKNFETKRLAKDGQVLDVSINAATWRDAEGELAGSVVVLRDITVQKKMESQLRQSAKMEAVGTLAGGIAHDFNNILSAIMGYTELALLRRRAQKECRAQLAEVLKACTRAKDLVLQILAFSRASEQELKPLDLGPIVKEALKLLRATLPANIEIRQEINASDSTIMADATQMHQVLMNLCTNAASAMSSGDGVLRVSLSETLLTGAEATGKTPLESGRYLLLSVSDTGKGIDPALLDKIFEPYFTTSEPGEGTGLGLAVTHGIVKSHGGAITVESKPGQGSVFKVYLPVAHSEAAAQLAAEEELVPGGNERILFVDDEEAISGFFASILELLGYEVTVSNSSRQALSLFQADPGQYDLLITDMTMSKMNGLELSQKVRGMRRDIPIIICTGFSSQLSPDVMHQYGINKLVMKPFAKTAMAQAIREVLD